MTENSNTSETTCPNCGSPMPANAPLGLCPKCLVQEVESSQIEEISSQPAGKALEALEGAGDMIGKFKLLQKIGEGGFGVVYMAEQNEPVIRKVALKIIKLGMDTRQVIARFEAERQALAMMDHPNIAKVLEAGSTDTGRPYFVMELVKGIPITDFCDEHRLGTRERLGLFMEVCSAVQHAHQKGIIHRDLKPSNILVMLHEGDQPVPKVIDFGIAKATQHRLTEKTLFTAFQQMIGTPAYMSPEQAQFSGLDTDTRSDIYSLGVLMYEMLTGSTPFDQQQLLAGGYDEICRRIREEDPPVPSKRWSTLTDVEQTQHARARQSDPHEHGNQLRGELDWVVMKAIEKDRRKRYETANALRQDIGRYLENEPVTAIAPSVGYKLQKFIRRNKLTFAASTAVAAALIIGTTVAIWQAVRANQHARTAEQRTEEALEAQELEREQRVLAEEAVRQAEQARKAERIQRYVADMAIVRNALRDHNATLGIQALEKHRPKPGEPDLRGWEWHYLYGKFYDQKDQLLTKEGAQEIAVSLDGHLIAIMGYISKHPTVHILSYPDLNFLHTHLRPGGWIDGLHFTEDASSLVVEKHGGYLMDIQSGEITSLLTKKQPGRGWGRPKISKNRRWAVGRFTNSNKLRELHCMDVETGQLVAVSKPFQIAHGDMRDHILQISRDGKFVTEGCVDGMLRIFSLPDLKETVAIKTPGIISVVAWSSDGQTVATGYGYPYQVDLWNATTGTHLGSLRNEPFSEGLELCFSLDGSRIAGADSSNNVSVWSTETLEPIHTYAGAPDNRMWGLVFHPDSRTLLGVSGKGAVLVWDTTVSAGSEMARLSRKEKLWDLTFSPDGDVLAAMNPRGNVVVFDAETENLLYRLPEQDRENAEPPHFTWAPRIAFSPDGRSLVAANQDHTATVYDIPNRRILHVLEANGKPFVNLRFSPDGRMIGGVRQDRALTLWDASSGQVVRQFEKVDFFDFHPNVESQQFVARDGYNISLVHMKTGEGQPAPTTLHPTWSVTISPDGKTLAAGRNNKVSLLSLPDLELITTIPGSRGPVPTVAFHPNGYSMAIPAWDGTFQVLNRRVNDVVATLPLPFDWVVTARFSPDGNTLAASTKQDGIRFFRLPPSNRLERWKESEAKSTAYLNEMERRLSETATNDSEQ